ncbi:insulinase family protein [Catenulispora sp. NF23]|uniref:Insulinase family protein n=1 Tax=Catenulispora pinistramenti TaxID=2705254 RepID=A0ABS5KRY1_9ACTN|nr:pitrilysin family protein [Catenulispora pinistramenti]MBS2532494.1 insulinase family protein [Catenulispora pinistramenti]MBS2548755.1 insulinase family protein [Catenulispora pinistramenti]
MSGNTLVADRPAGGAPRPYEFPAVDRAKLPGGEVVSAHLPGQRMAYAGVLLEAGVVREPAGKEGVGKITMDLLREGTELKSGDEFAMALESLGASWSGSVDADVLRVGVQAPVDRIAAAVALLAEALRRPRLAENDFDRVRGDRVAKLTTAWAMPGTRANEALSRGLYLPRSRYSKQDTGTVASVSALTLQDVRDFHAARLAFGGTLLLTGDLSGVDVTGLGEVLLGQAGPEITAPDPTGARDLVDREIVVVDRPGAVQSVVAIAHHAPGRDTPDYTAIEAMATILGGTFNSRLNHQLREVKGYTYGARGGFDLNRDGGVFSATASVHTEVTAAAAVDALAEIDRIKAGGVTDDELASTKAYRTGSLPIALQTPGSVGGALAQIVEFGLPEDYFTRKYTEYTRLTKDEVNTAAAKRLFPEQAVVVIEGDAEKILPGLTEAGIGTVRVDDEGQA